MDGEKKTWLDAPKTVSSSKEGLKVVVPPELLFILYILKNRLLLDTGLLPKFIVSKFMHVFCHIWVSCQRHMKSNTGVQESHTVYTFGLNMYVLWYCVCVCECPTSAGRGRGRRGARPWNRKVDERRRRSQKRRQRRHRSTDLRSVCWLPGGERRESWTHQPAKAVKKL